MHLIPASSYAIPTVNINTTGVISGPIEATGGKLNIENGKFYVTWVTDSHYAAGDIQIKGGIFSAKPEEEYCAEGYVATDNKDEVTKVQYPYTVMSKEDAGIFELFDSTTGDRYKPYSSYGITEDKNVQSVSYTRVFTTNDYNKYRPWYLPFDYTLTDDDLNNFDFYRISMIAGAAEAGEISTNQHQIILFIKKVESGGTLLANRPYILKAKELDEIMETVPWSPTPDDPAAKENNITFDDWDDDEPFFKDLWAEDEEEEKKELW